MEQFNDFEEATPEEVLKFLEHALDVFDSDKPEDTHVILAPGVSCYLAHYLQDSNPAFHGKNKWDAELIPERLHAYAEQLKPGAMKLSELAAMALVAYQLRQAAEGNAQWQMCIPKYLIEALFNALIVPGYAVLADDFVSLQDYR